jgi:hypothetical protein
MSKEPSKSDRQREMRERQYEERMARSRPSAPEPKIASREFERPKPTSRLTADHIVSTAAKALEQAPKKKAPDPAVKDVVEQIEKQKEAKAAKQPNREGKKPAMAWLDPAVAKALKIAAAKHEVTQETIVAEGIAAMLSGKYKP